MMNREEWEMILKKTLDDARLSGSEKRSMQEILGDMKLDASQSSLLRRSAFDLAAAELGDARARQIIDWLDEVTKLLHPKPVTTSQSSQGHFAPDSQAPVRIANHFRQAREKVDVCVFTITDDRISTAILDAHKRGVKLRILSDNDKANDQGSDIGRFDDAGIAIRVDRTEAHMHHKFAIFDDRMLLNGSYNWTRGAADFNRENYVISYEPGLVAQFADAFERLWSELA